MKAKLVRIGNSRGIRLPKLAIQEAGLGEEVELRVRPGAIVLKRSVGVRAAWAKAAEHLRKHGDARLLEPAAPTRFDKDEWQW